MSHDHDHSGHEHTGDWAKGEEYEPDMEGAAPMVILAYMIVLSVIFFASVFALFVYFRWERDYELAYKINNVESVELQALQEEEQQLLDKKARARAAALKALGGE